MRSLWAAIAGEKRADNHRLYSLGQYLFAVASVAAVVMLGLWLWPYLRSTVVVLFVLAIIVTVWFAGTKPALLALALSVFCADFVFVVPRYHLILTSNDVVWTITFLVVSLTIIGLSESVGRANRALRERDELREVMMSSLTEAVVCTDTDGSILFMNSAACAWTGWQEEDALRMPLEQVISLVDPYTRQPVQPAGKVSPAPNDGVPVAQSRLLAAENGSWRPIEESTVSLRDEKGRPRGYVMVLRDVAERLRIEALEHEAERLARVAIDALAANVCVTDASGAIVAVNRSWRHFAREQAFQKPDAGIGTSYLEACDRAAAAGSSEARDFATGMRQVLTGLQEEYTQEYAIETPAGTRWFIGRVRRFPQNSSNGVVIAHEDVTPLKRAEANLRALNETLEQRVVERTAEVIRSQDALHQAERLAVLGEMVTALSHESRNALQRNQTCLEMLARKCHDRPQALDLIAKARSAQADLERIHDEVREYAAPVVLERATADIAEVWRRAWQDVAEQRSGRDVALREEVVDCSTVAQVDSFRMTRVFRNLFENAFDACADPMSIQIAVSSVPREEGDWLRIAVRDNGPGLSDEQAKRIFEPFYTTKSRGTGLGMAIVKRVIETHGGTIAVDPSAGQGARIAICLPRQAPEPS